MGQLDAALQALQTLHIAFRGPFITPQKCRIYVVSSCILTEKEIVNLHEIGKFSPENVQAFLAELNALQMSNPIEPQPDARLTQRQRRSQRVMLRLNVLVRFEIEEAGRQQTHAITVAVNAHGGLLESPFRMVAGQPITLINPQSGKNVLCTVLRVHKSSEGYFATAFEFEQPSPQFWAISFPPQDWDLAKNTA